MANVACLSPGHSVGNRNQSPDGSYFEWEFNQDVCDKAEAWLKQIPGIEVVKVKEAHEVTDLQSRVAFAIKHGAGLFLEQHTNADGSGGWTSANGFGVYRYPGRDLAVARIAHRHSVDLIPMTDRGIRERNFYVLRETPMPALLFETGFHTNREDVAKLKTQEFRWLQAEVLVRTVCDFFKVEFRGKEEDSVMATPKHVVVEGDTMWSLFRTYGLPSLGTLQGFNPHIEDGASIKYEHGGDWVFLAEPNEFEREFAQTRADFIRCRLNAVDPKEISRLKEKLEDLEEIRLQQAHEIVGLRSKTQEQDGLLEKIEQIAASRPRE